MLATLGYSPGRRRSAPSTVVVAVLLLGLSGALWLGWHNYLGDSTGPSSALRAPAPNLPGFTPIPRPSAAAAGLPESVPTGRASSSAEAPATREPRAATAAPSQVARSTQPSLADSLTVRRVADPERKPATPSADSDFDLALRYHRAGDFENARQHYLALLERNELDAQAHNNLGLLYQEKGLLPDSARELHRAVALEPGNAGTHNNYGVTLLMQGRKDEAVAEFQSALTIEPGNLDARINLALAERSSGRIDVAKENLLDVLNRAPANAPAHYNLAQLYEQTNEPARAVEHYRLFLEHAGTEHADRAAPVRARIAALSKMPE